VGLAELDVGGAGQLVGAKLGGVSFAGGGGISAGEGAASLPGRGQMQWNGGKRGEIFGKFFLFLSGGMGEIYCLDGIGEIYYFCLDYYQVKPSLFCILK
jgi:hypothetical protein